MTMITWREIKGFLDKNNYYYDYGGKNTISVFREYLDFGDSLILGKFCISDKDPDYDYIYGYSKNQTQEERDEINKNLFYNLYLDSISFPVMFGNYLSQLCSSTKFCKCYHPTMFCECISKIYDDYLKTPNNHCTQYCPEFLKEYLENKDLHIDVILEEKYQDKCAVAPCKTFTFNGIETFLLKSKKTINYNFNEVVMYMTNILDSGRCQNVYKKKPEYQKGYHLALLRAKNKIDADGDYLDDNGNKLTRTIILEKSVAKLLLAENKITSKALREQNGNYLLTFVDTIEKEEQIVYLDGFIFVGSQNEKWFVSQEKFLATYKEA